MGHSSYYTRMQIKYEALRAQADDAIVLALESSCDETACAVMRGNQLLCSVIASQIEIHRRFGGVVPEIASRNHTLAIDNVVNEALGLAGVQLADVDAVAITYGAGLLGALIVGVAYAKALAYALDVPLIAVNHIKAHIAANYINSTIEPPYICLIASGGHTAIAKVEDYDSIDIIGTTVDDACGEAFDKAARAIGLPYPGGVEIEKLAVNGNDTVLLPTPFKGENHYNFSYSGLKTSVINYLHNAAQHNTVVNKADVACSFQNRAIGMLVDNTLRAAQDCGCDTIVIAGGVGANKLLRERMRSEAETQKIKVFYPEIKFCTDNAAMVASEARILMRLGKGLCDIDLDASANVKITD